MYYCIILANETTDDHLLWIMACEKFKSQVSYRVVDLTRNNWLSEIRKEKADILLAKPGGIVESFKQLFDERLRILAEELEYKVYPSLREIQIYENKRYLSFWLSAHAIPHPNTVIFYHKDEALDYIHKRAFPLVAKLNIGASGNGVTILHTAEQAEQYVHKIFKTGISSRTGPRMDMGKVVQRAWQKLSHPDELKSRFSYYRSVSSNPQRGFCIFQEFISHTFEWRVVRIGDSFFAHKKIVRGEKASGSLLKGYENPPLQLLDFVKGITDKADFRSQAIDIFETDDCQYLVNEMQCIFGQSDPYQMLVNGKPGRYLWANGEWVFEEGLFNTNESYDLRMEDVIRLLKEPKL
jgi:glutathione synthase/RimK-type ligase-like ATP-grasp enzyme